MKDIKMRRRIETKEEKMMNNFYITRLNEE